MTVIDSLIDGSDADGPGGAIFTLDGDVAVLGSTLNGNRADDRGGAISGEADVLVVNSTIARNLAVAHAGGGIWARGNLTLVNSTVTDNYAEGEGGGILSAGRTDAVISSTVARNIAPVAGDVGSGRPARRLRLDHRAAGLRGRHRRHHPDAPQLPGLRLALARLQLLHRRLVRAEGVDRRARATTRSCGRSTGTRSGSC